MNLKCTPYVLGTIPSFKTAQETVAIDCRSCKYLSSNQLLKCAVNPARIMNDDCGEFQRA
jgi:hypothetical protein